MAANRELTLYSFSHQNTGLEERDALAFTPEQISVLVAELRQRWLCEVAILSTCNRIEFYIFGPCRSTQWEDLKVDISRIRGVAVKDIPLPMVRTGAKAAQHVFRVAASLESLALGENQILGQVKDVHEQVLLSPGKSPVLDRLFQYAIRVGKLVRTNTTLCEGSVSISSAAVDLAKKIFGDFKRHKILIVGAGETAETAALHFESSGAERFIVINRGHERGVALAERFRGSYRPMDQLAATCGEVDVAVFATGSPDYLITKNVLKQALKRRSQGPIFLIDISNPRNVDPAIAKLDGVFLYNIDDLEHVVAANMSSRKAEIPAAEAIVEHMVGEWVSWNQSMQITPTIASLARFFDDVRAQELSRHRRLSEAERAMLEDFSRGLVKKLLHNPITFLRASVENNTLRNEDINLVWSLYDLKDDEKNDEN